LQTIGSFCGNVKLLNEAGASSAPDGIYLNSSIDLVYRHIKNLHFSSVFPYLSTRTKELQFEAAKISKASSPSEMKAFVKERLTQSAVLKKALAQHIAACESVVEQVQLKISLSFPKFEFNKAAIIFLLHRGNKY